MPKAVARYLRLSQEDLDLKTSQVKDASNSIISQCRITQRYVSEHQDLTSLPQMEFCDDGFSGTNFARPGFHQLLQKIKAGEVGTIVVKDLSRFGRSYVEVGDYLERIFPYLRIRVISVNDHYDSSNYTGKTGGIDIAFRNLINDYYSRDLSKKVKAGMWSHQSKAQYVNCVPYGYQRSPTTKHQMVLDPVAATIVRQIFLDAIDGKSTVQIARDLNDRKIPPPSVYKKVRRSKKYPAQCHWTHSRVFDILSNIKYTGTMVNHKIESRHLRDHAGRRVDKKDWIQRENAHEAIVTREEFQAANDALYRITYKGRKQSDPSTRLFYCGHCGHKLRKTYGDDIYYSCPSACYHSDSPCSAVRWSKTAMDEVLAASLKGQLLLFQSEAVQGEQGEDELESCRSRLARLSARKRTLESESVTSYMSYQKGELSREALISRKKAIAKDIEALEHEIEALEHRVSEIKQRQSEAQESPEAAALSLLTDEDALKSSFPQYLERITVYNDKKIEIRWNF